MTDAEIIALVENEFNDKTFAVTEQYLEIHQPVIENGNIVIARIDREKEDNIIVYIPVDNEYFFFAIYIHKATKEIAGIHTESRNIVAATFRSETISATELQALTKLKVTEFWDKAWQQKDNGIYFEPNPEPDEVEDKLVKLLDFLETDFLGIKNLSQATSGNIQILMDFHKGNQLLGGMAIGSDILKRISQFTLSINFQVTAWGNGFKDNVIEE